ncbi:MAG: nucleotidyltransferase domain-containing protein [Candidatus Woesearchaeota archaeon]
MDINNLGSSQLMQVIRAFLERPSASIEQASLESITGLSRTTIIKWVRFLQKEEILNHEKIGRSRILKLNNESAKVRELKRLHIILLLEPLKNVADRTGAEVWLYGSCARGEYYEESDADIILISRAKRSEVIKDIEAISEKIGRRISFNIFSQREWSDMRKKDKPFYERVEKDKVVLA